MRNFVAIILYLLCSSFIFADNVKILAYNVFLRPDPVGWFDYKKERFVELVEISKEYDIIGLAEVFDEQLYDSWVAELKESHPYIVEPPKKSEESPINGGVMIFSRYPITAQDDIIYNDKTGWDAFADKGAVYAEIQISEKQTIGVIMTHLQAGKDNGAIRSKQIQQLGELVNKYDDHHPLFIMGDMNVDDRTQEYPQMLEQFKLPTDLYTLLNSDPGYTKGGMDNPLGNGNTKKRVDYIFLQDLQRELICTSSKVRKFPMDNPIAEAIFMSDHYAVEVEVTRTEK